MSEESKKIEKIEKEAKQDVQEVKPTELSEQALDEVAGGGPNIVVVWPVATAARAVKQGGIGA